ncbi:hypothetical protein PsYK624_136130 [Phanerochaete sordida]|uniref:Uncharacterized protein n=1 Tax=Phanerochaete sordida TaxID=48140 RepID=A0A9P3GMC3_9APHY|nr:hypothetical protein PsYK624_136130 [Phanerochaete sordida]
MSCLNSGSVETLHEKLGVLSADGGALGLEVLAQAVDDRALVFYHGVTGSIVGSKTGKPSPHPCRGHRWRLAGYSSGLGSAREAGTELGLK